MRDSKWLRILSLGVTVFLLAGAAGCKTERQIANENPSERLPSLVGVTVSPMQAVFDQKTFSTTYRVEIAGEPAGYYFSSRWSGPDCGNWSVIKGEEDLLPMYSSKHEFKWYHPHPPCPETTDHTHVDVRLELTQWEYGQVDGKLKDRETGVKIICTYHGSESGTGPAPIWQ